MVETFDSYSSFIERFVLPLSAKNPGWKTLNGDAGSSQRAAAKFIHDGAIWKVDEDTRLDRLLEPYLAKRGATDQDVLVVTKTIMKTIRLKSGETTTGGNPKLVPKTGYGSARNFYVYFDKKA